MYCERKIRIDLLWLSGNNPSEFQISLARCLLDIRGLSLYNFEDTSLAQFQGKLVNYDASMEAEVSITNFILLVKCVMADPQY